VKKEAGINIGDAFADDFANSFTVFLQPFRIIFTIFHGNDADARTTSEGFLKKQPTAACVRSQSDDIETGHRQSVFLNPSPQRNSGLKRTIAV